MTREFDGKIKSTPPLSATPEMLIEAREACAKRARERGEDKLAHSYALGEQDLGWGLRFEVYRMQRELAS